MRHFKLDLLLSDDDKRRVALSFQDGAKVGDIADFLRRKGHRVVARDVRAWCTAHVLTTSAKEVEYSDYLDAIQKMHDFCEARDESFRTCMRKAIEMWIGWHSTDSHRRDAETQR
ncbi:MAG TPA: hypothetical protein VFE22_07640 [Edaphobacter sp.]|nr:hypothetical protein [Edaphobacter sp.]